MIPLMIPATTAALAADLPLEEGRSTADVIEDALRLYATVGRREDLQRQQRASAWDDSMNFQKSSGC